MSLAQMIFKGVGVAALVTVFSHRFPLAWWEGALISFGVTALIL